MTLRFKVSVLVWTGEDAQTLIELKLGNGLPLVRGYEPLIILSPTRKIHDELLFIVFEGLEDGF